MSNDQCYERLNSQLERLYADVRSLRTNQFVFWEVQEIIHNNPNLHKPSTFYDWMGKMYAEAMSVAIRRLVDHDKHTVSFVRLLLGIKANPPCFSRAEYKRRFCNPRLPSEFLDAHYDRLIGVGREQPDASQLDEEIKELKQRTARLKRFVDEYVAHSAETRPTELPIFQDVDDAIDYLEGVLKRYLELFRSVGLPSARPIWLFDWKEIFRYSWIQEAGGDATSSPSRPLL